MIRGSSVACSPPAAIGTTMSCRTATARLLSFRWLLRRTALRGARSRPQWMGGTLATRSVPQLYRAGTECCKISRYEYAPYTDAVNPARR